MKRKVHEIIREALSQFGSMQINLASCASREKVAKTIIEELEKNFYLISHFPPEDDQ